MREEDAGEREAGVHSTTPTYTFDNAIIKLFREQVHCGNVCVCVFCYCRTYYKAVPGNLEVRVLGSWPRMNKFPIDGKGKDNGVVVLGREGSRHVRRTGDRVSFDVVTTPSRTTCTLIIGTIICFMCI